MSFPKAVIFAALETQAAAGEAGQIGCGTPNHRDGKTMAGMVVHHSQGV